MANSGHSLHKCDTGLRCAAPQQPRQSGLACSALRQSRRHRRSQMWQISVAASGGNILQKLGRVLKEKATGDIDRVFKGTSKTRQKLGVVEELFTYWNLDVTDDNLEELEEALISADFGPRTALKVVDTLREPILAGELKTGEQIREALKAGIINVLEARGANNTLDFKGAKPGVLLIVGVNGGGKTTTIGKLAHKFTGEGATVRGDITHPFFSLILLPLCCLHVSLCDCGMSAIAMAVSRTPTVEQ